MNRQHIFRRKMIHSQNKATIFILALIFIYFFLSEFFGGSDKVIVLLKMGANSKELVTKESEYFRLLSSVFLHAGYLHLLVNSYVLYVLGRFFNRILGELRFLVLFFLCGIAGSLASIFIGHSKVSVGASGAIWGLLGASLALSITPNFFVPDFVRSQLKRMSIINLVINLGVSFLPMVDMWAHLGGGGMGFIVAFTMAIWYDPTKKNKLSFFLWVTLSLILFFVYMASFAIVLLKYKPWI